MWMCQKCGEKLENQFDSCWRCSTPKGDQPIAPEPAGPKWRMAYRLFRGTFTTWEELFNQAAAFATEVGPERVLNISHSEDDSDGVVTVWYWTSEEKG